MEMCKNFFTNIGKRILFIFAYLITYLPRMGIITGFGICIYKVSCALGNIILQLINISIDILFGPEVMAQIESVRKL